MEVVTFLLILGIILLILEVAVYTTMVVCIARQDYLTVQEPWDRVHALAEEYRARYSLLAETTVHGRYDYHTSTPEEEQHGTHD